jgi:hypothetical protein
VVLRVREAAGKVGLPTDSSSLQPSMRVLHVSLRYASMTHVVRLFSFQPTLLLAYPQELLAVSLIALASS